MVTVIQLIGKMMKNIFKLLGIGCIFCVASCQDDRVKEPTLVTTLEKNIYEVGENVRFNFSGDADFVTIFTGVDNYNAGTIEGNKKGSRYIYRERAKEPGQAILSFNCKKDGDNLEDYAEIKLLLSTDFKGDMTMEGIKAATWTDISDKAKWPVAATKKGTNVNSGNIDLSEWNGQVINLAFRYTAKKGYKQEGYTISSFTLKNTVETDALPFVLWTNASYAKFGTATDKVQEDGVSTAYPWKLGTSLTCSGMPNGAEDFESWVVSSPVDPSQVTPDYGTMIKSYSEVVPNFYDYAYFKPGKFTATVVSRNATSFGSHESVQNIEIEIVEKNTQEGD